MAEENPLLALAARFVVASDILKRKPCEIVYLQQDCLAAAEALRLAAKPADEGMREALEGLTDAASAILVNGTAARWDALRETLDKANDALSTTGEPKR